MKNWVPENGYSKIDLQQNENCRFDGSIILVVVFIAGSCGLLAVQIFFYFCIINPQELCSSGHGVNVEMLSFCSFLIHEAEHGIVWIPVNKDHGGDLKQHLAQVR